MDSVYFPHGHLDLYGPETITIIGRFVFVGEQRYGYPDVQTAYAQFQSMVREYEECR
jgi:hypothetical protein